ncbi:MAG TPA: hypothetical protein VL576_03050 [Candidatus Paceibacterota bacterium]|jgi:hypothetical protein|nr:hypothetical protein [Candidatus Paceibacterota bacterium]
MKRYLLLALALLGATCTYAQSSSVFKNKEYEKRDTSIHTKKYSGSSVVFNDYPTQKVRTLSLPHVPSSAGFGFGNFLIEKIQQGGAAENNLSNEMPNVIPLDDGGYIVIQYDKSLMGWIFWWMPGMPAITQNPTTRVFIMQ